MSTTAENVVTYPESDGMPMAENTLQGEWIMKIHGNLSYRFREHPDVFVAADNFWYPVEGNNEIVQAPDVYVVFGRPKHHRGSYRQWEEDDIPIQVVFEILSPSNTPARMAEKLEFYEHYGVQEYYEYDPQKNRLSIWYRNNGSLVAVGAVHGWESPRLGVRFDMSGEVLVIYHPDGRAFDTYLDSATRADEQAQRASVEAQRALEAMQRAREEAARADEQARRAREEAARADEEAARALAATRLADRLAARLRALGQDPNEGGVE
jgi:hypothetical protein